MRCCMAAAGYFCLMCGYYMLRPLREALALEVGVAIQLDPVHARCSSVPRRCCPSTGGWWGARRAAGCRGSCRRHSCWCSWRWRSGLTWYPRDRTVAFVYFVALSSANLYLISRVLERDGGRVAAGARQAVLSATWRRAAAPARILGPPLVSALVHETGPAPLIVIACAFIMGSALLASLRARVRCAARRMARGARCAPFRSAAAPLDDLARLARTPYLLGIAGIIIAGQIIGGVHVQRAGQATSRPPISSLADRAALFARMEFYVNVLSLVFQAVVVTWLTRRGSVALEPLGDAGADRRELRRDGAVPIGRRVARHAGHCGARPTTGSASRRARCCSRCSTRRASSRARASSTRCCSEARMRWRSGSICWSPGSRSRRHRVDVRRAVRRARWASCARSARAFEARARQR